MANVTLAREAEVAGYMVFKLGAAGVALGLGYELMLGGAEAPSSWLVYALSVTVAGAVTGSLGWIATARNREDRLDRIDARLLAIPASPENVRPAQGDRRAASPFRAPRRSAR